MYFREAVTGETGRDTRGNGWISAMGTKFELLEAVTVIGGREAVGNE